MNSELTFTDKADYLKFVADWKIAYKDLSQHIRRLKALYKDVQRQRADAEPKLGDNFHAEMGKAVAFPFNIQIGKFKFDAPKYYSFQYGVLSPWAYSRARATELIKLRADAKIVAGKQREAAKIAKAS
jgi:hypothetical protein